MVIKNLGLLSTPPLFRFSIENFFIIVVVHKFGVHTLHGNIKHLVIKKKTKTEELRRQFIEYLFEPIFFIKTFYGTITRLAT